MLVDQLGGTLEIHACEPDALRVAFPHSRSKTTCIQPGYLVVEDERVVAMHLRQQLSRLGYEVPAMATTGAKALSTIAELLPDIVLMDIHIEGDIDGIETAARDSA